jgi:hypothetical protein
MIQGTMHFRNCKLIVMKIWVAWIQEEGITRGTRELTSIVMMVPPTVKL